MMPHHSPVPLGHRDPARRNEKALCVSSLDGGSEDMRDNAVRVALRRLELTTALRSQTRKYTRQREGVGRGNTEQAYTGE